MGLIDALLYSAGLGDSAYVLERSRLLGGRDSNRVSDRSW